MANSWLRLWHDMPTDPKFKTIARKSKQPIALVIAVYVHLLVTASRNVTRGHADVTFEDLASALDSEESQIKDVFDAMQGRVLDDQYLTGWDGRQVKKEDAASAESTAKSNAQRKREQRKRDAEAAATDPDVTPSHEMSRNVTTDKDKEEIKSREEEKEKNKQKKPAVEKPKPDPQLSPAALSIAVNPPEGVTQDQWFDYLSARSDIHKKFMKVKDAENFIKAFDRTMKGANATPTQVIELATENKWRSVSADWINNKLSNGAGNGQPRRKGDAQFNGFAETDYTAGVEQPDFAADFGGRDKNHRAVTC